MVQRAAADVHPGTSPEALARLRGFDIERVTRTRFAGDRPPALAVATVASLGVASGAIALDAAAVERLGGGGAPVVLVRTERPPRTSPPWPAPPAS